MILTAIMTWITHPCTCIIWIFWTVEIHWAHSVMMMMWMMFGKIFVQSRCSMFPKNVVMHLANSILYPKKITYPWLWCIFDELYFWQFHPRCICIYAWVLPVVGRPFPPGQFWFVHQLWLCGTTPPLLSPPLMTSHFYYFGEGKDVSIGFLSVVEVFWY